MTPDTKVGLLNESHPKVCHHITNSVLSVKTLRRKQPTIQIKYSSGIVLCLSYCVSMATVSIERPRPRQRGTNMTQPCRADTVVEKCLNWDHPVLYSLHWLQVQSRVQFKILTSVFKALNGAAPCYLSEHAKHWRHSFIRPNSFKHASEVRRSCRHCGGTLQKYFCTFALMMMNW